MTPMPVQIRLVVADQVAESAVDVVGLALSAGLLAAAVAVGYRWYARERLPDGVAVLVGLGVVAVYLNALTALGQVMNPADGGTSVLTVGAAVWNVLAMAAGSAVGVGGGRVGDRVAAAFTVAGVTELDGEVGALVRAVGRVIVVELPDVEDVEDVDGHDPVDPETKAAIAGRTLLFPRGLTVEALRERLVDRLKSHFGVGVVDVDLTADGEVTYLALGRRLAGIGPTLPPGSAAVAVRADPPSAASPGDVVQVWRADEDPERVTTAEVRGTNGDVVTLAADEAEIEKLSPAERYRLVTLPAETRADREFAGLLRAAEETMGVVTVADGADLAGATVGELEVPVVAVRPPEGTVESLPSRSRVLAPGDTIYAVARPDAIRGLEARAQGGPAGTSREEPA